MFDNRIDEPPFSSELFGSPKGTHIFEFGSGCPIRICINIRGPYKFYFKPN